MLDLKKVYYSFEILLIDLKGGILELKSPAVISIHLGFLISRSIILSSIYYVKDLYKFLFIFGLLA